MVGVINACLVNCTSGHFGKSRQASLSSCIVMNDPSPANNQIKISCIILH